jgi:hypothetical protein
MAAFVNSGLRSVKPMRVLQAIAGGLLGPGAFTGGFATAALGAVLHFFIATVATAVYYLISRKLKLVIRLALVCGPLYGVGDYLFMNFIVLPLSAVTFKISYTPAVVVAGVMIHVFCVSLPIAFVVRRYSQSNSWRTR